MKIISVRLENFGSYETLDFDFQNQGLTLIQGSTGSGKSTLMDAIPWILFGKTAKGGAVDEILTWPGDKEVRGVLILEVNDTRYRIFRSRGKSSHQNDLHYRIGTGDDYNGMIRGKDLTDTQKKVNALLGLDVDLYLAGAYYHEFSQTAQFFTTTPKIRRQICEQIVDLSLPTKLQEKSAIELKAFKAQHQDVVTNIRSVESSLSSLRTMQTKELTRQSDWDKSHKSEISMLKKNVSDFEAAQDRRAKEISKSRNCPTCGQSATHTHKPKEDIPNPYIAALEITLGKTNPHSGATKDYTEQIGDDEYHLALLAEKLGETTNDISNIELLQDVVSEFRGVLITNTILQVEENTNRLLTGYFNGELRITLDITITDKLEVGITKDGNTCSFTQLSKGQRQLLKLCFALSVMQAVGNSSGVSFDSIFLDEVMEGLDDNFKTQALRLLESLSSQYSSVFFVEHSETVKASVNNKYHVELVNGQSQIKKA